MLKKEEIDRLQRIVRDSSISLEKRREAFEQLQHENTSVWESGLRDFYKEYETATDSGTRDLAKHRIYKAITRRLQINSHNSTFSRSKKYITGIAAAVAITIGLAVFYQQLNFSPQQQPAQAVVAAVNATDVFDTLVNDKKEKQLFLLPDSTSVELSPESAVYFRNDLADASRIVYLIGEAKFSVHKKDGRPFSVYADEVEVRDLGTVFYVKSDDKKLKVRLIQGKVLIHALRPSMAVPDIAMVPGQEFAMNTLSGIYSLNFSDADAGYDAKAIHKRKSIQKAATLNIKEMLLTKALPFSNTPVDEVLKSIEQEFGVTVRINTAQNNLLFTGQFTEYMSLSQILDVIARSYELDIRIKGSVITLNPVTTK